MSRYILRTCKEDMTSHGGFAWPEKGHVEAPDWKPIPECGNGLHGLLNGIGNGRLLDWSESSKWLVCEIEEFVDLGGKVKFPSANVVFCGTKDAAIAFLAPLVEQPNLIVGSTLTGGDYSTLTGGYGSTLTGGYGSTLTGGDYSTLTGGYGSTLTGGYGSTLTGGDDSTLTGGDDSTLTGGYGSTLTGGDYSTLTGGYGSTLTGGYGSTLTGGDYSTLTWRLWDGCYWRITTHYVNENGVEPNTEYMLENGILVKKDSNHE